MIDVVLIALILIFVISTVIVIWQQRKDRFYQNLWIEERRKWDELYQSYIELSNENTELKKQIQDNENRYYDR